MRFDELGLQSLLGDYRRGAASKTKPVNGDVSTTVSISRIAATLLQPGIADVAQAINGFMIGMIEGRLASSKRWKHIDIELQRLAPRKTLADIVRSDNQRKDYQAARKKERSVKSEQSVQHDSNTSMVEPTSLGDTT